MQKLPPVQLPGAGAALQTPELARGRREWSAVRTDEVVHKHFWWFLAGEVSVTGAITAIAAVLCAATDMWVVPVAIAAGLLSVLALYVGLRVVYWATARKKMWEAADKARRVATAMAFLCHESNHIFALVEGWRASPPDQPLDRHAFANNVEPARAIVAACCQRLRDAGMEDEAVDLETYGGGREWVTWSDFYEVMFMKAEKMNSLFHAWKESA